MKAITIVIMDNSGNSHTKTMTSEDDIFSINVMPLVEDTDPEKSECKIDGNAFIDWLIAAGDGAIVVDNYSNPITEAHIGAGVPELVVMAPGAIRALIRYVDDYRAGKEITDRFADEFTKIITDAGFECDLRN